MKEGKRLVRSEWGKDRTVRIREKNNTNYFTPRKNKHGKPGLWVREGQGWGAGQNSCLVPPSAYHPAPAKTQTGNLYPAACHWLCKWAKSTGTNKPRPRLGERLPARPCRTAPPRAHLASWGRYEGRWGRGAARRGAAVRRWLERVAARALSMARLVLGRLGPPRPGGRGGEVRGTAWEVRGASGCLALPGPRAGEEGRGPGPRGRFRRGSPGGSRELRELRLSLTGASPSSSNPTLALQQTCGARGKMREPLAGGDRIPPGLGWWVERVRAGAPRLGSNPGRWGQPRAGGRVPDAGLLWRGGRGVSEGRELPNPPRLTMARPWPWLGIGVGVGHLEGGPCSGPRVFGGSLGLLILQLALTNRFMEFPLVKNLQYQNLVLKSIRSFLQRQQYLLKAGFTMQERFRCDWTFQN